MKVGIDSIAFSTSKYFFDLRNLALYRKINYLKYCVGIGQTKMSVFPPNEDIITTSIDAAQKLIPEFNQIDDIETVIFATESAFDLSKSAGIYVHHFLNLKNECRVFEVKQACYSLTGALQIAKNIVLANPKSKVLIIGSDIVKYAPHTSGEPTQGGAAVAMIISQNPRILELENYSGIYTANVMDFWRPIEAKDAIFDGKLSAYSYLKSLDITFNSYLQKSGFSISDIDCACFHTPFGKMARKANQQIFKEKSIENTLVYNSIIGNSCSASLYIALISLLDNDKRDLSEARVGLYSYGSGCVAEFFSGIIVNNYNKMLHSDRNQNTLNNRTEISFDEYKKFYTDEVSASNCSKYQNIGTIKLAGIENNQRIYKQSQ